MSRMTIFDNKTAGPGGAARTLRATAAAVGPGAVRAGWRVTAAAMALTVQAPPPGPSAGGPGPLGRRSRAQ